MSGRRRAAPLPKATAANGWMDVVIAVIVDGERVVVTRRPLLAHLGDHDEFPGGRREAGESLEAACVREVKEEVGLDVAVEKLLSVAWFEGDGRRLALTFFQCKCVGATTLDATAVSERSARWVAQSELTALHFPPANAEVVRKLTAAT